MKTIKTTTLAIELPNFRGFNSYDNYVNLCLDTLINSLDSQLFEKLENKGLLKDFYNHLDYLVDEETTYGKVVAYIIPNLKKILMANDIAIDLTINSSYIWTISSGKLVLNVTFTEKQLRKFEKFCFTKNDETNDKLFNFLEDNNIREYKDDYCSCAISVEECREIYHQSKKKPLDTNFYRNHLFSFYFDNVANIDDNTYISIYNFEPLPNFLTFKKPLRKGFNINTEAIKFLNK